MKRTPALAALALATALTAATWGSGEAALGAGPSTHRPAAPDRGGPGKWTKVSTGTVGITFLPSLVRSGNGDLHLVYARDTGGSTTLGHTALHTNGQVYLQNTILTPSWVTMDPAPVVVNGAGDLRVVFGGDLDLGAGFWSDGRMYTATSDSTGANWGLPAKAVGQSHQAYGSYGTAATTLADGTPIAGFPLGSVLTWHVGTASNPDQTYDVGPTHCCIYNAAMVRDGSKVYVAWYQNDDSTAGNGTFVKQIYPTIGPTLKAPGSSKGANSLPAGRVALAARRRRRGLRGVLCRLPVLHVCPGLEGRHQQDHRRPAQQVRHHHLPVPQSVRPAVGGLVRQHPEGAGCAHRQERAGGGRGADGRAAQGQERGVLARGRRHPRTR